MAVPAPTTGGIGSHPVRSDAVPLIVSARTNGNCVKLSAFTTPRPLASRPSTAFAFAAFRCMGETGRQRYNCSLSTSQPKTPYTRIPIHYSRPHTARRRQPRMTKVTNVFGTRFSGRMGRSMIASSWKGKDYVKTYVKPRNPRTEAQQEHRSRIVWAVRMWRDLSDKQHQLYDRFAASMSGYNLFVKRAMKAAEKGLPPGFPIPLDWKTADGKAITNGDLIVRKGRKTLFIESLEDASGGIALTPSDTPYTFALRKGTQEDKVLEINDLLDTDVPLTLESKKLGIKLVMDAPPPPANSQSKRVLSKRRKG